MLIAASIAESKHIGSRTWGDADDRVKATNLALLATDRDTEHAEALFNEMVGEARKLVEKYWPDIEELAEQLLIEGKASFEPGHGRRLQSGDRGVACREPGLGLGEGITLARHVGQFFKRR